MNDLPDIVNGMPEPTASEERIDNETFVRLLTQNERKVYGYILSLVPNWADADEILQETNVRLWQQFEKYEPGTDFAAWAMTVAYYQVLTYRKRASRQKVHFSQEFVEAVANEMSAARKQTDVRESALVDCVQQLNEQGRKLIELCYQRGIAIRDAAGQLGRSVDATYKSLSRVRQSLHRCVEQRLAREAGG